jgi:ABC-type enterobactin transport system permease subunit
VNSTVETIDDLAASVKLSVKWYGLAALALVIAAVGLFVVLVANHLLKEALTLAGPGAIVALAVPALTQMGSRMERVGLLGVQRQRALRAGSDAAELRKVEDAILVYIGKW